MASAVLSVASSRSAFSYMEDDAESCGFDSSDNASAASNHQDMVSPHGVDSPSISIDSHGSWNIVVTDAQKNRMYQTPSPALQTDANAPFDLLGEPPPFGDASEAQPREFGNSQGSAYFDFLSAYLDAQQQTLQDQYGMEANPPEQPFDMTQSYHFSGHNAFAPITCYDFPMDNLLLQDPAMTAMDPQPQPQPQPQAQAQPLPQYSNMHISARIVTDAPPPCTPASVQAATASAYGQFDHPSIERLTPSSSSIELSPELPPGSPRAAHEARAARAARADVTGGIKRKDRDTAAGPRRPRKRKSPSPRLLGFDPKPGGERPILTFCNMSPENWNKGDFGGAAGASRPSHKGRKGALSEDTRANALAVRKTGACFCCHVRKVRCDQQRPCKNCLKSCSQLRLDICWQFDDFTKTLFPTSIRKHFGKEEMTKFVSDNVQSFTLNGIDRPCIVILSSGPALMSKLVVKARFFTARKPTSDVLHHWFQVLDRASAGHVELERMSAVPIGLEMDNSTKSSELRKKVEAYVQSIAKEPEYAQTLTASVRKSRLPCRMLQIVQEYARQSEQSIVKLALSIYAMHYVLTRHLTLTQQSIEALQWVNPVRATGSYMTPRLLNRQIKAVADDLAREGVKALFDDFGKRLKKKSKEEWAPCMAAFLVLCMLMEAMEAAADVFAISENEVGMRKTPPATFERTHALQTNKRIEDGPFRQFAYQFHQIYQTHSRDASAKSFNPLADDNLSEMCNLDCSVASAMVQSLREVSQKYRLELQSLTADPRTMDLHTQNHPWPRDVSEDYVGRLWSRFLLSFTDSCYIFGT